MFPPNFSCSMVLCRDNPSTFQLQDFYLLWFFFPEDSPGCTDRIHCWPLSRSLAATREIAVAFFSSGY